MNGDRQVELTRGFVQWKEIGIAEPPVRFQASQVNTASAVFFPEFQFVENASHVEQWRNHHPTKTVRRFSDDVGHPAVVAPAQGEVDFRPTRGRKNKYRRIDHLGIDVQFVLVHYLSSEISHFPVGTW